MADLYNLLGELEEPQEQLLHDEEEIPLEREQIELPVPTKEAVVEPDEEGESELESFDNELYMKLRTMWTQELYAPELLPYDEEAMASLVEALREHEDALDDQEPTGDHVDALLQSVHKIDIDRVKFLMADLVKLRLQKIERYPLHMRNLTERMSASEVDFLKEYGTLLMGHLQANVLGHFPQEVWQRVDEPDMIDEPDLNAFVFARVIEPVVIVGADGQHPEGACLVARYARIRDFVLEGKLQLMK